MNNRTTLARIAIHMFLLLVALSILLPVFYILCLSFSKAGSLGSSLLPEHYSLDNYIALFTKHRFRNWLVNSVYLSLGTMLFSLVLAATSAWIFSRWRFRGRTRLFEGLLVVQVFPLTLSMVAIHKIFDSAGLLGKIEGLILVDGVIASAGLILLAKGYFDSLPWEIDEAAQIDGAGKLTVFLRIILPLAKPMLAIIAVQSFCVAYNEFVIASIVMTGGFKSMPLAVGLQSMLQGQYATNWPVYCAAALVSSVPMLIVFYAMQRYVISGLADGAIK